MLADAVTLGQAVREAAARTLKNAKLCAVSYGTVTGVSPLTIHTDQQMDLFEAMLDVPRSMTDYEVDIEVSWQTEEKGGGSGDPAYESHRHELRGRKKVKVYNALKAGDRVMLIRQQGAQKWAVLDRVAPDETLEGEWI